MIAGRALVPNTVGTSSDSLQMDSTLWGHVEPVGWPGVLGFSLGTVTAASSAEEPLMDGLHTTNRRC